MALIQEEIVPCVRCGSTETVKCGCDRNGKQRYKCNNCRRCWAIGANFRDVRELPIIKFELRPLPSVDSMVGVPCFGCSEQHRCNPELCDKLLEWLENEGN